jgi:hypothetical protein
MSKPSSVVMIKPSSVAIGISTNLPIT